MGEKNENNIFLEEGFGKFNLLTSASIQTK